MKDGSLGPLRDGGTVVVLGGGPGGTATAMALRREANALGRALRVVLVESKQFDEEQHYNQCVGVLSPPIVELFRDELNVPFPQHLCQTTIAGYILHTARRQITLEGDAGASLALRRVQFDAYMLACARERGVEILRARATGLEFHADRVVVYTEMHPVDADVVVGAFGMDEGSGVLFSETVGYRPPPALSSVVTKYHPDESAMAQFGAYIHAYLPKLSRIEFGAITPKRNHLTINIAGTTADADLMEVFLRLPEVRAVLPGIEAALAARGTTKDLTYFKGRFPCGLAKHFSGDRFVLVGDAAGLVRAFKGKGITSALQTGMRAARTICREGISRAAFKAYHAANADILSDLPYGQGMRHLTVFASRWGLMDIALQAAQRDAGLRSALFDAVSAHRPYRDVIAEALSFSSVRAVVSAVFRRSLTD